MTTVEAKIAGLEARLHRMNESSKDNSGVQRKVERELRNLRKQQAQAKAQ